MWGVGNSCCSEGLVGDNIIPYTYTRECSTIDVYVKWGYPTAENPCSGKQWKTTMTWISHTEKGQGNDLECHAWLKDNKHLPYAVVNQLCQAQIWSHTP